jgi:hypothetical protein
LEILGCRSPFTSPECVRNHRRIASDFDMAFAESGRTNPQKMGLY